MLLLPQAVILLQKFNRHSIARSNRHGALCPQLPTAMRQGKEVEQFGAIFGMSSGICVGRSGFRRNS